MRQVFARVDGDDVSLRIMDHVTSQAVTLDHHNVIDQGDDFVYLDVGRWGGSDRFFGVVYGNEDECHVALCEYVGESGRVRDLPGQSCSGPVARVVREFLNTCQSRIVDGARFQTINTAGKLYLLLGDLHVPIVSHLCRDCRDGGTERPEIMCRVDENYMRQLAPGSLTDFFNLRGLANLGLLSPSPDVDRILINNINEWYRRYLENDIFTDPSSNAAAQDLQRFITLALGWQVAENSPRNGIDRAPIHFVQLGDMYELWVGLKRLFEATPSSQREVRIAAPPCRRNGASLDRCYNYSANQCQIQDSETTIRYWVNKVHENTTVAVDGEQQSLCCWLHESARFSQNTWLTGNHDCYLRTLGTSLGLPRRYMNLSENGMLIEHGHEGDAYNRDGSSSGHDITQGGAFLWNLRPFVALGEDSQRRVFLGYSVKKFIRPQSDMKFFAMAHTHLPYLAIVTVTDISR